MKKIYNIILIIIVNIINLNAQWEKLSGLPCDPVWTLMVDSKNPQNIFAGIASYLYASSDYGDSWNKVNSFVSENPSIIIAVQNQHIYVSTPGLRLSHDYGKTWGISIPRDSVLHLSGMPSKSAVFKNDTLFIGTEFGPFTSTDYGDHWVSLINQSINGLTQGPTYNLLINNNKLYIGSGVFGIIMTKDNGKTWNKICEGLNAYYTQRFNYSVPTFFFINNKLIAWADWEGKLFTTTDDGTHWSLIRSGFGDTTFDIVKVCNHSIFVDSFDSFGGNYSELYTSIDEAISFNKITGNLPKQLITDIAINDKYIYAACGRVENCCSIWRAKLQDCQIVMPNAVPEPPIIKEFNVAPNPASDFIEISGCTRLEPALTIQIYNVIGECVYSMDCKVGVTTPLRIDVSSLSPGLYFVRVGEKVSKFVVVR